MTNKAEMYENPTNDRWQCVANCNTVLAEFNTQEAAERHLQEIVREEEPTWQCVANWHCLHVVGPGGRIQLIEF